jgi:hypothetical protein
VQFSEALVVFVIAIRVILGAKGYAHGRGANDVQSAVLEQLGQLERLALGCLFAKVRDENASLLLHGLVKRIQHFKAERWRDHLLASRQFIADT